MQNITEQFKAWVRSKPADESYDYRACSGCALYHFLVEAGYPVKSVAGDFWRDNEGQAHGLPFDYLALAVSPWTFGELAKRLDS